MLDAGVFLRLFVGVITGTDQRTAFDDAKAEGEADLLPVLELLRPHPAGKWPMLRTGLQVLANGEDVDFVAGEVAHRLLDLRLLLPEAEHEAGLRRETAALRVAQHGAAAVVAGRHPHGLLQALHGFDIVIVDVGLRRAPGLDCAEIARARADFAQNHERGGAARPALADVRATCALADSVQLVLLHHTEGRLVGGAGGKFDPNPRGFTSGVHHRLKNRN